MFERLFFIWVAIWTGIGFGFHEKGVVTLSLFGAVIYLVFKISLYLKINQVDNQ
jgi:hypothetical protein